MKEKGSSSGETDLRAGNGSEQVRLVREEERKRKIEKRRRMKLSATLCERVGVGGRWMSRFGWNSAKRRRNGGRVYGTSRKRPSDWPTYTHRIRFSLHTPTQENSIRKKIGKYFCLNCCQAKMVCKRISSTLHLMICNPITLRRKLFLSPLPLTPNGYFPNWGYTLKCPEVVFPD